MLGYSDNYTQSKVTPTKMSKINSRQIQGNMENFNKIHALSACVRN